jgi:hypothetical protein
MVEATAAEDPAPTSQGGRRACSRGTTWDDTRPPTELLTLRSATSTYLAMLGDVEQWAQQAADVNRLIRPDYAEQLDNLRVECQAAQEAMRTGSPAAVLFHLAPLLGEA